MNYRIHQLGQDERLDTRLMEFTVDGKRISTPCKTIDSDGHAEEINEISVRADHGYIMRSLDNPN